VFDVIVLAVVGICTLMGLWKGMVKQFFGLMGVIAGYLLAVRFYLPCSKFLTGFHGGTARAASFVAIFLLCILVAHVIAWVVGRHFAGSGLGFLNRLGGAFLGLLKGCLIVAFAVMALMTFFPAHSGFLNQSSTMKKIIPLTAALRSVTRTDIKTKYEEKTGMEKPARSTHKRSETGADE
jgi:membrane protein required for colicin V production